MTVESSAAGVELLYACRCGDYFSFTSCELGEMGILVSEDGEIELQAPDSLSTSVVLGCGSCCLKPRLVINKT
jgi:diphthamide biosynthesis protein 4